MLKSPKLWAFLFALLIALATIPRAKKLGSPDFRVFYVAARHALTEPANVYQVSPDRYLYPPSTALLLTPFAFSEHYALHQWIWHALLAALVFALASPGGAALFAMVVLSRYLAITFGYGQINLVVMGLLAGAGAWLAKRPAAAGALWALAVSLKVYPAVLAPAFLTRIKGLGGAALAGALILALPLVFFGPGLGILLYGEFLQALEAKGLPVYSHNQSISALLLRLFTDQSFLLHGLGEIRWSFLSLDPGFVRMLALLLGAGLTAATWWRAFRCGRGAPAFLSAAAFSILFLSHIVWKDYLLFLFFPLAELFSLLSRKKAVLLGAAFVGLVTFSSPDLLGPAFSTRLDAASIHLWAAVLVWFPWLINSRFPLS